MYHGQKDAQLYQKSNAWFFVNQNWLIHLLKLAHIFQRAENYYKW